MTPILRGKTAPDRRAQMQQAALIQETLVTCYSIYGHSYEALYAAAECLYIQAHRALPAWSCYIERFEVLDGYFLFIHRDPKAAQ